MAGWESSDLAGLIRPSSLLRRFALSSGLSIVGGFSSVAFLYGIYEVASGRADPASGELGRLAGLLGLSAGSLVASNLMVIHQATGIVLRLRLHLAERALTTPLRDLEELGPAKALAAIISDASTIGMTFANIPTLLFNVSVLVAVVGTLFALDPMLGLVGATFITSGLGLFGLAYLGLDRYFKKAREAANVAFAKVQMLVHGATQLKLDSSRRDQFLDEELGPQLSEYRNLNRAASYRFSVVTSLASLTLLISVLILLAYYPRQSGELAPEIELTILLLIYAMAPILHILGVFSPFLSARAAQANVDSLISSEGSYEKPADGVSVADTAGDSPRFASGAWKLKLEGLCFSYGEGKDGGAFEIGPVDLEFAPSEVTFIIGGNGSGKTTFLKLLCSLYEPTAGTILWDGMKVTGSNRAKFRNMFGAIFGSHETFPTLSPADGMDRGRAESFLSELRLDKKVRLEDWSPRFEGLSSGEAKRLALLDVFVQDKPILIFDEWAAEQQPSYRDYFYSILIPRFRAEGKCIVVVSHDDAYFHVADRLVELDLNGRMLVRGLAIASGKGVT